MVTGFHLGWQATQGLLIRAALVVGGFFFFPSIVNTLSPLIYLQASLVDELDQCACSTVTYSCLERDACSAAAALACLHLCLGGCDYIVIGSVSFCPHVDLAFRNMISLYKFCDRYNWFVKLVFT